MPAMPSADTVVIASRKAAIGAMTSAAPRRIVPAPARIRNSVSIAWNAARSAKKHGVCQVQQQAGLAIATQDQPTDQPGERGHHQQPERMDEQRVPKKQTARGRRAVSGKFGRQA